MDTSFEEELLKIVFRLTDLIVYSPPFNNKGELIQLLDRLNNLSNEVYKRYIKETKTKATKSRFIAETFGYMMFFGEVKTLRNILVAILEKISDIEKQNKLSEEKEKEVLEQSKQSEEETNYVG